MVQLLPPDMRPPTSAPRPQRVTAAGAARLSAQVLALQSRVAGRLQAALTAYFQRLTRRVTRRFLAAQKIIYPNGQQLMTPEDERELELLLRRYAEVMMQQAVVLVGQMVGDATPFPDEAMIRLLGEWTGRTHTIAEGVRQDITRTLTVAAQRGYGLYQTVTGVLKDGYRGLADVLAPTYRGRAETIARTEMAYASQTAAHQRYDDRGVTEVDITDGVPCGWRSHTDPDQAHGSRRTLEAARQHPIAHPNCRRVSIPVLDVVPVVRRPRARVIAPGARQRP